MTIASAIQAKQQQVAAAYTACNNKGATMPSTQNLTNLATCIGTISGGGSSPVITSLNVTPTTSAQTITAPSGTDGYSPVNVAAVTSSIDANITAGNIKKDVQILGVTGTYEGSGGGGGIGITREVKNGVYQMPTENFTFSLPSDVTDVGDYSLAYAFQRCKVLTSVDLSSVTTVGIYGLAYAFQYCTGLTSLDLSSLTTVGNYGITNTFYGCTRLTSLDLSSLTTVSGSNGLNYAFRGCTGLTSVDLSSLTIVSGNNGLSYAFYDCTGLTSVDLSSLTIVSSNYGLGYIFRGCTVLTSVDLSSLTIISGGNGLAYAFYGCTKLTNIYFRALTTSSFVYIKNQFVNMMQSTGNTITHTIHFPSNMQSTISGLTGYPLFGGASGYVVLSFDLPATYTLTGANATTYSRNPKHDTSTALAWKVGAYGTTDFEPAYYTSGLTDPQANDTIYSDSACMTSVTTISSIS